MFENDESAVAIGKRLKRLRQMAGLTRTELAEKATVGRTSLTYWEHAKANPMKPRNRAKILAAIKDAGVECSESWLLTGTGLPPRIILQETPAEYPITIPNTNENRDKEIKLFTSLHRLAVVITMENNCMAPVFEKGDTVGGVWQSPINLTSEKICIVQVEGKIQVRRVRNGSQQGQFHLAYLVCDPTEIEPFELKDFPLQKIAPVIRLWR